MEEIGEIIEDMIHSMLRERVIQHTNRGIGLILMQAGILNIFMEKRREQF